MPLLYEAIFDYDNRKKIILSKEKKSLEPDFWNNREEAEKVLKEISINKTWVEAYDNLTSSISDLETLYEFYQAGEVDEEEIIKRLIDRAREDDKPDIIKNRFKTYNSETQPLIPFYEGRKKLFNINGMQKIEKVSEDIKKVIGVI